AYAWYDVSIDTLYVGMNFYGTVGDSLDDANVAACERTIPSVNCTLPNDTRTIFDGNETYNLDLYNGTDTSGTNLLQYILVGIESTDGESTTGTVNPFGLTLAHSVSEANNGVEFSIGGLYASGALPDFSYSNPADLHLVLGAGSSDLNPVSSGTEDTFALQMQVVPVPAAVWLFGSGLAGLVGVARRKASRHN
ncbi:MAG: VPLPA-CTERM sorting domain-containing protein, partial [Thiogranum sp.]|nr:VPLPA-CTERM sorting domain-containing protein [Thiogranum sp.]